jgi:TolB-like protein
MGTETKPKERPPPVDRFSQVWSRVNEHKLVQWTVGYVAVAYAIQHAVVLTSESFEWPNAVARSTMLLLVLGLPFAITFAWYHGARASRQISRAEMSIIAILLVIGTFLFYTLARPSPEIASTPSVKEAGVTAARSAAANPRLGIALAVLPFANLSDDKQQEYFSDGVTEEITSALAKIPDLSVVARTSAFQFKAQNRDIQSIGQQLHATHFIEGSVRKAGDRVRITAELVKADNGVTIWTDSYDRQLTDVFAIQEDIAHAVATSLHMTLGLKPGEALVKQRPRDAALHDQYLRARNLLRTRRAEPTAEAIRLLNDVVTRDPGYAPAWAVLAEAYGATQLVTPEIALGMTEKAKPIIQDLLPKIEAAAEQAIKLDPNTAEAYCALGGTRVARDDHIAAMELRQRGLAIDPDYPDCLNTPELLHLGFVKQALAVRDHLLALEPLVPVYRNVTARVLFADGQYDAAIAMLNSLPGRGTAGNPLIAQIYAARGRYREAADLIAEFNNFPDPVVAKLWATAARLLRNAPAVAPPDDRPELGLLDWVYVYTGAPERFMNTYDRVGYNIGVAGGIQWAPAYHSIRQTERFKKWIRDSGIYAYWRAKGWPPQCHPTTGDDFECS